MHAKYELIIEFIPVERRQNEEREKENNKLQLITYQIKGKKISFAFAYEFY